MGEVVRFPGRFQPDEDQEDPRLGHQRQRAQETDGFFIPGTGRLDREEKVAKVKEIVERIEALIGQFSQETLQMRRDLVSEVDPESAADIILASSQQDWLKHPTYYKAIAEQAAKLI